MRTGLVVASLLLGAVAATAQQPAPVVREVRVTAQQVRTSPPAYVFLVTNLASLPLNLLFVGGTIGPMEDRVPGIIAGDLNTPTRLSLPAGWTGEMTGSGGGTYFSYMLRAVDLAHAILPGASQSFRVDLPVFEEPAIPLFAGKIRLAQTDFNDVAFLVLWPDAARTEGSIRMDPVPTAAPPPQPRHSGCVGPTGQVRLTAQQVRLDPPAYVFLFTNLTDTTIWSIVVGRGDQHSLKTSIIAAPFNLPTSMRSPDAWSGLRVIGDESPFVTYLWRASDPSKGVRPGESLTGFAVELPPPPAAGQRQFFENTQVVQPTFANLPFAATGTDGGCYWGTTGVHRIESESVTVRTP